jgi:hypothetical protein
VLGGNLVSSPWRHGSIVDPHYLTDGTLRDWGDDEIEKRCSRSGNGICKQGFARLLWGWGIFHGSALGLWLMQGSSWEGRWV